MRRSFFIAVLASVIVGLSVAYAQLACPPMPDKVTQVNRDVRSDVDVSVGSLGKMKAGQLGVKTDVVAKNLFDKYPNTDRVLIAQMMSATYCGLIRDSKSLGESEKIRLWTEFSDRVFRFTNPDYKTVPAKPKSPKSGRNSTPQAPKKENNDLQNVRAEPRENDSQHEAIVVNEKVGLKSGSMAERSEPSTKSTSESLSANTPDAESVRPSGLLNQAPKDSGPAASTPITENRPASNSPSDTNSSVAQPRTSNEVLDELRGVLTKDRELAHLRGCPAGKTVELRRVADNISYYVCVQQCFATWQSVSPKNLDFGGVSVIQPRGKPNLAIVKIPCLQVGLCLRYQEGTFPDSSPGCYKAKISEDDRQSLNMIVHTENLESVLKLWKEFAQSEQKP